MYQARKHYQKRRLQQLQLNLQKKSVKITQVLNSHKPDLSPPLCNDADEGWEPTEQPPVPPTEQQVLQEYGEQCANAEDELSPEQCGQEAMLQCDYGSFMRTYNALNFPLYTHSTVTTLEAVLLIKQFILNLNTNNSQADNLLKLIGALLPYQHALPGSYKSFMKVCTFAPCTGT